MSPASYQTAPPRPDILTAAFPPGQCCSLSVNYQSLRLVQANHIRNHERGTRTLSHVERTNWCERSLFTCKLNVFSFELGSTGRKETTGMSAYLLPRFFLGLLVSLAF